MEIFLDPKYEQLQKVQARLENDSKANIFDIFSDFEAVYALAKEDGADIGVICLRVYGDSVEIFKLYILPEFRRKGKATIFLDNIFSILEEGGVTEVLVEVLGESYLFWEHFISKRRHHRYDVDKFSIYLGKTNKSRENRNTQ